MSIIPDNYNGHDLTFLYNEEGSWIKMNDLAKVLEYANPTASANNIFSRNKDELEEFSRIYQIDITSGKQDTRFLNKYGARIFCMLAKTDKAKEIRKAIAYKMDLIEEKQSQAIKPYQGPTIESIMACLDKTAAMLGMSVNSTNQKLTDLEVNVKAKFKEIREEQQEIKAQLMDMDTRVRLKRMFDDKRKELADTLMEHGWDQDPAWGRIRAVIYTRYGITKYLELDPIYYQDAIDFLQSLINDTSRFGRASRILIKRNSHLIPKVNKQNVLIKYFQPKGVPEQS